MEGVGARLGRSSTRYGLGPSPAVFSGPVRKWKKKWVHISPSAPNAKRHGSSGAANSNKGSRLLLFKWTKTSSSSSKDDVSADTPEEPPRRKFKYVPIALLEDQKIEAEEKRSGENIADELKQRDINFSATKPNFNNTVSEEKADINGVPMGESPALAGHVISRHDLNEGGTFDLSLG